MLRVYIEGMPKRSSTRPDLNELAKSIVDRATNDEQQEEVAEEKPNESEKDPAAVSLGRRGGLKGGPARAAKLTAEQRKESARNAAVVRWNKR